MNFADHPKTLGEIRSERSQHADDWAPRDALIDLLREIDSGRLDPDLLVICYRAPAPNGSTDTIVGRRTAGKGDKVAVIGLLQRISWIVNYDDYT